MNLNLIAILLSLAMMLTGVGGTDQPAQASRSLVLRNVNLTRDGETVTLTPQARLGVSTDGEKAVYDFGVDVDGEKLLPVQLGVDETGVTALFGGCDKAVTVSAKALEGLMEQANAMLNSATDAAQAENPELMQFITEEFMPAYVALIQAASDPEQRAQINEACQAVFDEKVQRGEGTPDTAEIDGETYDVIAYSYTLEDAALAEVIEAIYNATPVLTDYYNALFKLYSMLPEESGLTGIDSFTALFEQFGMHMRMDIDEKRSEDGGIDVTDAVVTMDLSAMAEAMQPAEAAVEETAEEAVEEAAEETAEETTEETADAPSTGVIQPIVMNLHTVRLGDYKEASGSVTVEMEDGQAAEMKVESVEDVGVSQVEMTINSLVDGQKTAGGKVTAYLVGDGAGSQSYNVMGKYIIQDALRLEANVFGFCNPDGTSQNSFAFDVQSRPQDGAFADEKGLNFTLSFDLDVTADAIEDAVNGHAADCVIDDLSQEGLEAVGQDPAFMGVIMQAFGAFQQDAAKLVGNDSVQNALRLAQGERLPISVDELDAEDELNDQELDGGDGFEYVVEDEEGDEGGIEFGDVEEEEVEDDGVLSFNEPKFTWLPEGWTVTASNVDTAYDWVEMMISDSAEENNLYAVFYSDSEMPTASYTITQSGDILEGRGISVTDFGEDGLTVTLREGEMCGNLMFSSSAVDVDTIAKIVAGIEY